MRSVIQRVSSARVTVAGETVGEIGPGLLVLLGVAQGDTDADAQWLAGKICALRIFQDEDGKMNLSLKDLAAAEVAPASSRHPIDGRLEAGATPAVRSPFSDLRPLLLVISQFTLIASTRKGTRPSFNDAAKPDLAIPLYESFLRHATAALGRPVATGRFGAMMEVSLVNDGPVTLVLDSRQRE
jgi:D-tyrosyl-tRNA(Tyr) deacylase